METTEDSEQISRGDLKRARAEEAARSKKLRTFLWVGGIIILIAFLIWLGIFLNNRRLANLPGTAIPDLGRDHVGPEHQHTYNSNPPTSGWHFSQTAEWGVYQEELPDGSIIHNLEHGGIWISYKPGISSELKAELENFFQKYGRKIIVTPRTANDSEIALAAWGRLDKFSANEYSAERVDNFIEAFRNKGPEFVP